MGEQRPLERAASPDGDDPPERGARATTSAAAEPPTPPRPSHAFPSERRLKKRWEFLRIQRHGRRIYGRRFIFQFMNGATGETRLGVTASKKVGNAVVRNRIKRWVREAFRQHPELHRSRARAETPYDVVVTAKRGTDDFTYARVRDELVHVLTRYLENPAAAGHRHRARGSGRGR